MGRPAPASQISQGLGYDFAASDRPQAHPSPTQPSQPTTSLPSLSLRNSIPTTAARPSRHHRSSLRSRPVCSPLPCSPTLFSTSSVFFFNCAWPGRPATGFAPLPKQRRQQHASALVYSLDLLNHHAPPISAAPPRRVTSPCLAPGPPPHHLSTLPTLLDNCCWYSCCAAADCLLLSLLPLPSLLLPPPPPPPCSGRGHS